MTTATLAAPGFVVNGGPRLRAVPPVDSSPATTIARRGVPRSLADRADLLWAGLQALAPVACPICDGRMEPRITAGSRVVGGRCVSCGTELS